MTLAAQTKEYHSLIGRLFYHAKMHPDQDAIVSLDVTLSYAKLASLVQLQAYKFYEAGISSSSLLGIKCADDTQHLTFCLAAAYVGATSCTIPLYESEDTQQAINKNCGVSHVIDESYAVGNKSAIVSQVNTDGLNAATTAKLLFSTSGTTGTPKLVVHHDSDIVAQAHRHIVSAHERFVCLASMEHNFAKRHRLYCVAMGATNVFIDTRDNSLLSQCQSLNVNVMHVSAFQAQELLAIPRIQDLSNIQLKLGGSHVSTTLRTALRNNITPNLRAGYGTTETGAIAFTDPDDAGSDNSVGRALPGIEIQVRSASGKLLTNREAGELFVRCDGMFRGYLGKPELTASRLIDGWFHTGDIAYLDKAARIHLCGRSDDMFVFNSINIYPQDIESEISQFPNIVDTAVLSKPSTVHGNIPVALVVFSKEVRPRLKDLEKFLKQRLGLRAPRQLIIVDEIPRNASGKIVRQDAVTLSAKAGSIRKTIIQALSSKAKKTLRASQIAEFELGNTDIPLRKIDLDSIGRMELLVVLELAYDVVIHPNEYASFRYLGNLVARVLTLQSQPPGIGAKVAHFTDNDVITEELPYVVRFFRRIVRVCPTVAHLNRALTTLEYRLTPLDIDLLHSRNRQCQLVSANQNQKYQVAIDSWLDTLQKQLSESLKLKPEAFVLKRIAPTATLFIGVGVPSEKGLLICFPGRGDRSMMISNPVLLQHTNSADYDVLILTEPRNQSYRQGIPFLGDKVSDVINWLVNHKQLSQYGTYRTMGCSAGSYPALLAAYQLRAELVLCIGGRFHKNKRVIKILERIYTIWRAQLNGHRPQVLLSYSRLVEKDRQYARVISRLFGGNTVEITLSSGKLGHRILADLLNNGGLNVFLTRSIFANTDNELYANNSANIILSIPENTVRKHE
ncbi:class I adenylate-forming enzyme family protein [Zhongshania aquimaris]|uniref:Fatty acid--CoA ligase family protein n=1 Tax=Zhongshania aquimaris TaxID=2857107 RepID=A0ABS6VT22_9GAMM|nr:fatty acid--CoA ligase family protein [Zhongshania aquimaris]